MNVPSRDGVAGTARGKPSQRGCRHFGWDRWRAALPARYGALMIAPALLLACSPVAIDGDTLRCGRERIRLLGIDAPELPGHCRRGRACAPGDPVASRDELAGALAGSARVVPVGRDRYGRLLARVIVNGHDLSCHQLAVGAAIYKPRWDDGGAVARACPTTVARADQ